jgi:hypothetical protein
MKLDRLVSGALFAASLAATCALAGGCSNAAAPATSAQVKTASADLSAVNTGNVAGTTNLMSAQIPGPAPRVGKAHLAVDDELESGSSASQSDGDLLPKDARPSDGSRRGGGFGSSK